MPSPTRFTGRSSLWLGRRPAALSRRMLLVGVLQSLTYLAACTMAPPPPLSATLPAPSPAGEPPPTATPPTIPSPVGAGNSVPNPTCVARLTPVVAPTPLPYPGYAQYELSTKLHVTGPAQQIDLAAYRLNVTGKVDRPLSLSFDDLRCLPKTQAYVRLECPGFFVDWANLAGPSLAGVLALAGPQESAQKIELRGIEGRSASFSLAEGQAPENFLANEWEGQLLPASHGFPLRAVLPGRIGGEWVKWLVQIDVS